MFTVFSEEVSYTSCGAKQTAADQSESRQRRLEYRSANQERSSRALTRLLVVCMKSQADDFKIINYKMKAAVVCVFVSKEDFQKDSVIQSLMSTDPLLSTADGLCMASQRAGWCLFANIGREALN